MKSLVSFPQILLRVPRGPGWPDSPGHPVVAVGSFWNSPSLVDPTSPTKELDQCLDVLDGEPRVLC